jgi:hypothetical protein
MPLSFAKSPIVIAFPCLEVNFKFYSHGMTTATTLLLSLLCVGMCAAADKDAEPRFVCNLKAISAAERPRYNDLIKRIRAALRERRELATGYTFRLDSNAVTLTDAAEWIAMERLCCPFLTLQLSTAGSQADWVLTLTGPEGVKPLITAEFPIQ